MCNRAKAPPRIDILNSLHRWLRHELRHDRQINDVTKQSHGDIWIHTAKARKRMHVR